MIQLRGRDHLFAYLVLQDLAKNLENLVTGAMVCISEIMNVRHKVHLTVWSNGPPVSLFLCMLKDEHYLYRLQIGEFNFADNLLLLGLAVVEDSKQVASNELGHKGNVPTSRSWTHKIYSHSMFYQVQAYVSVVGMAYLVVGRIFCRHNPMST